MNTPTPLRSRHEDAHAELEGWVRHCVKPGDAKTYTLEIAHLDQFGDEVQRFHYQFPMSIKSQQADETHDDDGDDDS